MRPHTSLSSILIHPDGGHNQTQIWSGDAVGPTDLRADLSQGRRHQVLVADTKRSISSSQDAF